MCLGMTLNSMHFYAIILEQYGPQKLLKFLNKLQVDTYESKL